MNEQVANILKVYLKDLPWVQVVSGLAKTIGVKTPVGDPENPTFVTKKYPAPCMAPDVCSPDALPKILIPEQGKRSIVYFEDGGVSFVSRAGNHMNYISRLKLVVWLNTGFFTSPRCNITPLVIADIKSNLPTEPFNMGGFTRIKIVIKGEDPRTFSIFSKYNYDAISNLFIPPYDYFALNLETAFSVDPDCMDAVVIQEDPCIGPNEDYRDPDCPDCPDINPNCCDLPDLPLVQAAIDNLQSEIDSIVGGNTNLGIANATPSTLDITSSTGTGATIPAATNTNAGLLTGAKKILYDGYADDIIAMAVAL